MTPSFREKAIRICNEKILKKGENVGLSFYAFFGEKIKTKRGLVASLVLFA